MLKNKLFIVALLLACFIVQSQNINQEVIASQGSYDVGHAMTLEWTLGEAFVETLNDKSMLYTQGFHQPTLPILKSISDKTLVSSLVFPNPTKNKIEILVSNYDEDIFYIQMYDLQGRLIKERTSDLQTSSLKVDISNLHSGIYLLQVIGDKGSYQKTHRIIKQ